MAQVSARIESQWHASTSTTICSQHQGSPRSEVSLIRSGSGSQGRSSLRKGCENPGLRGCGASRFQVEPKYTGPVHQNIRCIGRGPNNNRVKRGPTLDSPTPYKPLWTPGGFSPPVDNSKETTNEGTAPAPSFENVPMEETDWAAKAAREAATRKELLEQLRNQLGTWHERVRSMRILQKAGDLSAEEVADEARLFGLDSTRLLVAGSVHDSLANVEPDVLNWFDSPTGPVILYELRTLSVAQRGPVAEYIVDNGLDADGARELVKAVKDHERRPEGREGFTEAPGDALAFWYFRNAGETREPEKRARLLEKAAAVAESESAKERVSESN